MMSLIHFNIDKSPLMLSLAREFGLGKNELMHLVCTAPRRYKTYYIRKRHKKGRREISQPTPEVKFIQRWLIEACLSKFPVHEAAMAYEAGKSIRQNASLHASNKYLMKLDFEDFFPSLESVDILALIEKSENKLNFTTDDKIALTQFLFRGRKGDSKLRLSIGAPSSPKVSNILMYEFDTLVSSYCEKKKITYSRYADDLTFSTNIAHVLNECLAEIRKILKEIKTPKLKINEQKTVFSSKKHNRRVTGLVLTNDGKVSLGRDKKRVIRAKIHHFQTSKLNHKECLELKGHLAHAYAVEKDFVDRMRKKYGDSVIEKIQSYEEKEQSNNYEDV